jgi:AraC-like DNA-binding protein
MIELAERQLAYLGFCRVKPSRLLQPYIRTYWHFRRDTPLTGYHEEYMHPTGGFGIVLNFGDEVALDGTGVKERVFLDGSNTISRKMGFYGTVDLMGIRFYAGGAYPFLDMPLHELQNETALVDALNDPSLIQLHAHLHDLETPQARIHVLEEWLMIRLTKGKERHPILAASLNVLEEREHPFISIPNIAREFAISQRQLERIYQTQVGMSPIQYSQLQRVEKARLALKQTAGQSTTRLAMELGFYDQAHFIREFKTVVGITPYKYLKKPLSRP